MDWNGLEWNRLDLKKIKKKSPLPSPLPSPLRFSELILLTSLPAHSFISYLVPICSITSIVTTRTI